MAKLVSKTYGEALLSLAIEENKTDELYEQVCFVKEVFAEHEDLMRFMNHPQITKEEKIQVTKNIFGGRISDDLVGFLVIIAEKGRYNELDRMLSYFIREMKQYKKIGVVTVVSASALSDAKKQSIEKKLLSQTGYTSLEMNYQVNEALIGGMTIQIGDRVVDASIKQKLDAMARELKQIQLA